MKQRPFILLRDSSMRPELKQDDIIYEFIGHDFGCVRDDWMYGGLKTKAMSPSPDGSPPFFTVPEGDMRPLTDEEATIHWSALANAADEKQLESGFDVQAAICPDCNGYGITSGWVPTYSDPDNSGGGPAAEPCHCEAGSKFYNKKEPGDGPSILVSDDDFNEPLGKACSLDNPDCESCS